MSEPIKFWFEGRALCFFEAHPSYKGSRLIQTRFNIDHSDNLIKGHYIDENDLPTEQGFRFLSLTLTQGLVGCIHAAHQQGYWVDHEHLKYIIDELTKGFAEVVDMGTGKWNDSEP